MKRLVTLWKRPSYDGTRFTYYLLYTDEQGKRRQKSLRHTDARKAEQPKGYPYVFVPPFRYDRIQQLRKRGTWTSRKGVCPLNNFTRQFRAILHRAGIEHGEFHDLRRTCLSNWFANGLREYDVMKMAGHSSFETTREFYLAIREDLLNRTRMASAQAFKAISVAGPTKHA